MSSVRFQLLDPRSSKFNMMIVLTTQLPFSASFALLHLLSLFNLINFVPPTLSLPINLSISLSLSLSISVLLFLSLCSLLVSFSSLLAPPLFPSRLLLFPSRLLLLLFPSRRLLLLFPSRLLLFPSRLLLFPSRLLLFPSRLLLLLFPSRLLLFPSCLLLFIPKQTMVPLSLCRRGGLMVLAGDPQQLCASLRSPVFR